MKIKNLNQNKSSDPNRFHLRVTTKFEEIAPHFCDIYKASSVQRKVVKDQKEKNNAATFKVVPKDKTRTNRPITLTPVPGKILESFTADSSISHLQTNGLTLSRATWVL